LHFVSWHHFISIHWSDNNDNRRSSEEKETIVRKKFSLFCSFLVSLSQRFIALTKGMRKIWEKITFFEEKKIRQQKHVQRSKRNKTQSHAQLKSISFSLSPSLPLSQAEFHQHSKYSFYARRAQKSKKRQSSHQSFYAFGIYKCKSWA